MWVIAFILSIAVISSSSSSASKPAFSRNVVSDLGSHGKGVFGIPRGGGLFGKNDGGDSSTATTTDKKMYPPLTREEIEEWMAHIPVFAITNSEGAGIVLKPDNDTSVSYFFMTPQMANATLQSMKTSNSLETMEDLRISVMSLGKVWFKLLHNDDGDGGSAQEIKLKSGNGETTTNSVEYRLVPDTRDLMGARMLLTMDPAESEKLKDGGSITPEDAQKAIQKAMDETPKFKGTYNEIPVFMIAQMRIQNQKNPTDTPLLPMYFSLQRMVGTWQHFASQDPNAKSVEPAINLMDLKELVDKMQEESEIDFRNVLLEPQMAMAAAAGEGGELPDDVGAEMEKDQLSQMGGETLGDL